MSKIFEALQRMQVDLKSAPKAGSSDAGSSDAGARQDAPVPPPAPAPAQSRSPIEEDGGAGAAEHATARVLPLRVSLSAPLFPFDQDHWYAGEQYKIIRTKINQHPRQPRLIAISSAGSADGKSITAINLAAALSLNAGARVLLMDGDFRRSTIHLQLGLPEGPGLLDLLAGASTMEDSLIRAQQYPNLFILPAGATRNNPAELLGSPRWTKLARSLRESFDFIIVDTPPISAVADYDLIVAAADAVVVVVRPDHTNRKALLRALDSIDPGKSLGVILNYIPDWFLGGSQAYYSHYEYRGHLGNS